MTQKAVLTRVPSVVGWVGKKDRLASCVQSRKALWEAGTPGFFYVLNTYAPGGFCLRPHITHGWAGSCVDWPGFVDRGPQGPSPNRESNKSHLRRELVPHIHAAHHPNSGDIPVDCANVQGADAETT